mmetsp:Transcript_9314/g.24646  ORF Transcript_9314/g.24646 Transcript_9314/m.24646 type:complete len:91 (+) Transcript_9314:327-599(+)
MLNNCAANKKAESIAAQLVENFERSRALLATEGVRSASIASALETNARAFTNAKREQDNYNARAGTSKSKMRGMEFCKFYSLLTIKVALT